VGSSVVVRSSAVVLMTCLVAAGACSGRDEPGGIGPGSSSSTGGSGGGFFGNVGGGPCVADGACGDEVHVVEFNAPNIYFVFDRSGSMAELVAPDFDSRFEIVRDAAKDFIQGLGPLINIGAAVFPLGNISSDPCSAGDEVMPVMPGDPFMQGEGPTTQMFGAAVGGPPNGGTPVAATLQNLEGKLSALDGQTIVMLLTDGGPNCNDQLSCGIDECMPNIEGVCEPTENCCDPSHPQGGPQLCIDDTATNDAISTLAALGIELYVIGITGSEIYEGVLNQMAVAAGTAQTNTPTQYFQVTDLSTLSQVFADIAADAISCELPIADPPTEEGFTNVYLDCELVTFDPAQGWDWVDESTVRLNGASCNKLKSGQVVEVKIVTGCPTELPK
jgi:hypothetical protein